MNRLSLSAFALGLCLLPCTILAAAQQPQEPEGEFFRRAGLWVQRDAAGYVWTLEQHVISVRWKGGVQSLDSLRRQLSAQDRAMLEGCVVLRENALGIADLRLAESKNPIEVSHKLEASGLLEFAETNTRGEWLAVPNDPSYSTQWALNNIGQTGGTPGADINIEGAWDITTGDPSVMIAVIDSGTNITHPDLAPNLYHNPIDVANGVDDDNNGLVDDLHGWDFNNNNNDVTSQVGHGSQVAGIVSARSDNGLGIAGVAGGFGATNGCTYVVCQIGDSFPVGSAIDDAIIYAADQGARVITMSLGVGGSLAITNALDYAANTKGVFINCASGNTPGNNNISYPARNPNVVAVGATGNTDAVWANSSGGPQMWIVAPGELILSTTLFSNYGLGTGTSFASPQIAGIAALMFSINPALTRTQVADIIKDTAVDVGAGGFDNRAGWGRVDAAAAVGQAGSMCGIANHCVSSANSTGSAVVLQATGSSSVAVNNLVLSADNLPLNENGLFFYGPGERQAPFGPGHVCVQGPLQRLSLLNSGAAGFVSHALDLTSPRQPSGQISAGTNWSFQLYYRDAAAGGAAFNTSDGLTVNFCP